MQRKVASLNGPILCIPRRLANDFGAFTRIFADILKVKNDSALVAQNQLTHGGTMLR